MMNNDDHGKILKQWDFLEFEKPYRSKSWYLWMGIIAMALLIYSVVTVNFLFAVIIIIAAITLLNKYRHEPQQVRLTIAEDGLELENRFHPWEVIKNFYMIYKPPEVTNLYFDFKSVTKPRLTIPLAKENPVEIRKILSTYIEEDLEKENEPFSEALSRRLKL